MQYYLSHHQPPFTVYSRSLLPPTAASACWPQASFQFPGLGWQVAGYAGKTGEARGWRLRAAGWPQMSAKWSKCVQTTITKNIVDEGKKLERKTRQKMTTKEAFPTRNIYIIFFLYFLWDNKYNQLDNSWIFGIFALFTFITFRVKQSCR